MGRHRSDAEPEPSPGPDSQARQDGAMDYGDQSFGVQDATVDPVADAFRVERDTMGEVRVPATALWRAQTQRAVENFPVSGRGLEPAQIRALARIKAADVKVNAELGVIATDVAAAIIAASQE